MKRKDLTDQLESHGWKLKRSGSNHDIYSNGKDMQPIPRHREINERLAKEILKRAGI